MPSVASLAPVLARWASTRRSSCVRASCSARATKPTTARTTGPRYACSAPPSAPRLESFARGSSAYFLAPVRQGRDGSAVGIDRSASRARRAGTVPPLAASRPGGARRRSERGTAAPGRGSGYQAAASASPRIRRARGLSSGALRPVPASDDSFPGEKRADDAHRAVTLLSPFASSRIWARFERCSSKNSRSLSLEMRGNCRKCHDT